MKLQQVIQPAFTKLVCTGLTLVCLSACSSSFLKVDNSAELLKTDDFDKQVKVAAMPNPAAPGLYVRLPGPEPVPGAFPVEKKKLTRAELRKERAAERAAKRAAAKAVKEAARLAAKEAGGGKAGEAAAAKVIEKTAEKTAEKAPVVIDDSKGPHLPPLEDSEGFAGRRPIKDPYRVGEKITLEASYFGVTAGELALEVRKFVEVNGRKSYTFAGTAISTSVFAAFYAVNDWFETFVDFDRMIPYTYALHVKETKQLREARSIFNWQTMTASFWDKKVNDEKKIEEKKQDWTIPAYSQNIFSIAYYIRAFQLRPGKKIAIRLAHENENLIVTTEVLAKERLSTDAGDMDTVKTKVRIEINGVFKPVGDIFIWFTDDDRKFIVRMESKIKIGTVVASLKSLDRGADTP